MANADHISHRMRDADRHLLATQRGEAAEPVGAAEQADELDQKERMSAGSLMEHAGDRAVVETRRLRDVGSHAVDIKSGEVDPRDPAFTRDRCEQVGQSRIGGGLLWTEGRYNDHADVLQMAGDRLQHP